MRVVNNFFIGVLALSLAVPIPNLAFVSLPSADTRQHLVLASHRRANRLRQRSADSNMSHEAEKEIGCSQLLIRNDVEEYDLNGVLTIKNPELKSVWILCHGLCSSCEGTMPRFISEKLDANTYRFDFAGCGRSGGEWRYAAYNRELGDLRAVVTRLREQGWTVECILGHSKGAAAVLLYGEEYDDVPLIVNVSGRFDTTQTPRSRFTEQQWDSLDRHGSFVWDIKGEELTVRKTDFEERAALDMRRTASAIKRSRVLTIHGSSDETIPVADASEFDKLVHKHELVIVEGGSHRFGEEFEQEAVIKALTRYLM